LISLAKMENGQLEVGLPRAGQAPTEAPLQTGEVSVAGERERAAAPSEQEGKPHGERGEERGRRGRRGGRGRGREARGARDAGPAPTASGAVETVSPVPTGASVPEAAPVEQVEPGAAVKIGASGERLTREEAFDLVRRAVMALQSGDRAVRASDVRGEAFELLGRDSESLSERNFARILRDAHDADVIDLRRRGDDYEVVPAAAAAPVAQQLNVAAAAARGPEVAPAAASAGAGATMPRGLGVRGVRRGGLHGRPTPPPPDLLSVGIVDVHPTTVEVPHRLDQAVELVPHAESRVPTSEKAPETAESKPTAAAEGAPRGERRGAGSTKRPRSRSKRGQSQAAPEPTSRTKRGGGRTRAASKSSSG
jgi:hypothetical protein